MTHIILTVLFWSLVALVVIGAPWFFLYEPRGKSYTYHESRWNAWRRHRDERKRNRPSDDTTR